MSINGYQERDTERIRERINMMLQEIPPDSLAFIEQFVQFMRQRDVHTPEAQEQAPYLYPTVPVPASTIMGWSKLLDKGYEGDAVDDTEGLYDEV